ncbi:prepilin peptidase [Hyphomicrobium facile]|uniref:Leader peptidase (Prepilin peptidase) / N-methyltransferase n=1 Tax=Hyphomicrobium facile TaxID=51670 RepID=A0A1I7NQL8_9HYPH|nr:A24 family peptidase [Hyphomicrobium facile]SFV36984.1 leader peptidase (prepilin peptidase) / N-methyltransferase [Hyphomicrobium facile]
MPDTRILCRYRDSVKAEAHQGRASLYAVAFSAFWLLYLASALPVASGLDTGAIALSLGLATALALLSAIDVQIQRLPDNLTFPLAFAGILASSSGGWAQVIGHAGAALLGFFTLYGLAAFYRHFRNKDGLGLGDAKLLAAAGAWVGIDGLPSVLLISSGVAVVGVLLAKLIGTNVTRETRIAFGPFLAFGLWIVWLYGPLV